MSGPIVNSFIYSVIVFSLFLVDYFLGNGFVDTIQKIFCKISCFIYKKYREEAAKNASQSAELDVSVLVLILEVFILWLTMTFLSKLKQRGKDHIDELLIESKEALRQTNEFLDKWRHRHVNRIPEEQSYLDEEPQEIKPLKLQVPILHMAIIDTRGTSRSQPERGDAGDTVNITDSTILSVTSLLDDEAYESISDLPVTSSITNYTEKTEIESKSLESRRFLFDVIEEDSGLLMD